VNTLEKRQKRCELWTQAKALMAKADGEKRALRGEEEGQYQALCGDIDRLGKEVEHEERSARLDAEFAAPMTPVHEPGARGAAPQYDPEFAKKALAVRNFIRGKNAGNADPHTWRFEPPDPEKVDIAPLYAKRSRESRALVADNATSAGYLAPVEQFVATLIKFVDDYVFVRRMATVMPLVSADSLGAPSLDNDLSDPDWTEEIQPAAEDTAMTVGKRALKPTPLSKLVKISNRLIRISAINVEQLVAQRLAYKFAIAQEKGFLTGPGTKQGPLGLFTPSADGIPGSGANNRDTTASASTAFTGDDIIATYYSVKAQYQDSGVWIMHRDTVQRLRKLKDGNSNYIWAPAGMGAGFPSLSGKQADTIMGRPLCMSEYAPNTFTTGKYVMLFGDLSFYWIAESLSMQLQRLMELYAINNQVGYIGRMEIDGQPVLAEAFARLKLA